jgi:lysophospholipase L1-like esterase
MGHVNAFLLLVCAGFIASGCAARTIGEESDSVAQADTQTETDAKLLALGDSIAFGYNPLADFKKVKNFVGYPEVLKSDFTVKNASCPGETSASLFDATAPDNGCRAYRAQYPLHVNWGKNPTQLDYALGKLEDPTDTPTLVTLNVSGNDIFLLQAQCANDPRGPAACFAAGAPALIGSIANNVATIFASVRGTAGYKGRLVYMTLYTVDYNDATAVSFVTALNSTVVNVARQFGAQVADAYGAFQTASAPSNSACTAKLLISLPSGGCDVHPSPLGAQVLAQSVRDAH